MYLYIYIYVLEVKVCARDSARNPNKIQKKVHKMIFLNKKPSQLINLKKINEMKLKPKKKKNNQINKIFVCYIL